MKVCFLSQEYPPEAHLGGIGTYTHNVAMGLACLGHEVHVVTSTWSYPRTYCEDGVWVHSVRKRSLRPAEVSTFYYSFQVARRVLGIGERFDIVHASEFRGEGYALNLLRRFPMVTRLATPFYLTEKLNGRNSPARPLLNWIEKTQTLRSDGIISSTTALAKAVAEDWQIDLCRIRIIPNSIDIARVLRLAESADVPEILAGKEYLLYFGRLEERKGVPILAEALPCAFEEQNRFNMVFVGADTIYRGGSMRAYIRRVAGRYQERLFFFDNLPQEKLFPIVKRAKLVVLPSLWEAFGFVCLEAMALGRPVLASSGSGFEEIIVDGKSGCLVTPGNAQLLANGIIRMLENPEWLGQIRTEAIARSLDFELSEVLPVLIGYYESIRCRGRNELQNSIQRM